MWSTIPSGRQKDDLDQLPLPDREAAVLESTALPGKAASSTLSPAVAVPTTAPTASTMPWLISTKAKGRRLRQLSVGRVIEEVKWVQERYPMQFVVFLDDLFIVYTDWLRELAEKIPAGDRPARSSATSAPILSPRKDYPAPTSRLRQRRHGLGDRQPCPAQRDPQAQPIRRADHRGQPFDPGGRHTATHNEYAGLAGGIA